MPRCPWSSLCWLLDSYFSQFHVAIPPRLLWESELYICGVFFAFFAFFIVFFLHFFWWLDSYFSKFPPRLLWESEAHRSRLAHWQPGIWPEVIMAQLAPHSQHTISCVFVFLVIMAHLKPNSHCIAPQNIFQTPEYDWSWNQEDFFKKHSMRRCIWRYIVGWGWTYLGAAWH